MGEEQWGTVHSDNVGREDARKGETVGFNGLQGLNIRQGDLGGRKVEDSGVPLHIHAEKTKDRVCPSLINSSTVVISQKVDSICKGILS